MRVSTGIAARMLGVSASLIGYLSRTGQLRHYRTPSRRLMFDVEDLQALKRERDARPEHRVGGVTLTEQIERRGIREVLR